jgi:hypothetical protein
LPVDLFARLLGSESGTYDHWLVAPSLDGGFARRFVLATWWLGAMLGGMRLWHHGSKWRDVPFGIVAGGVAGIIGAASLACLWPMLDAPARWVWRGLAPIVQGHSIATHGWLWTPLWLITATLTWAAIGALLSVALNSFGNARLKLFGFLASPWAWLGNLIRGSNKPVDVPHRPVSHASTHARLPT